MLGGTLLTWAGLLTSAASLPQQQEVAVEQEAKFTSPPVRLMVNQGSSFRLPCTVEDIGAFILLWKAGGTILSVGERVVVEDGGSAFDSSWTIFDIFSSWSNIAKTSFSWLF